MQCNATPNSQIFGPELESSQIANTAQSLGPARYAAMAAAVAAGAFAGSAATAAAWTVMGDRDDPDSMRAPDAVRGVAAAVGAGAASYGAYYAEMERRKLAPIALHRYLQGLADAAGEGGFDPAMIDTDAVAAVAKDFATGNVAEDFPDDVQRLYYGYLNHVVPMSRGGEPLDGSEATKLREFLDRIGLADEEAARVHIAYGKTAYRQRMEIGGGARQTAEQAEERDSALRTFQKIVYLSDSIFGAAKAAYLVPWKRELGLTSSQVEVAKRDTAVSSLRTLLDAALAPVPLPADAPETTPEGKEWDLGMEVPGTAAAWSAVRQQQVASRVPEDVARDLFAEYMNKGLVARAKLAENLMKDRRLKRSANDTATSAHCGATAIKDMLTYCKGLESWASSTEEGAVPEGMSVPTLKSHPSFSSETKTKPLEELYQFMLAESLLMEKKFTDSMESDLADLASLFGLDEETIASITEKQLTVSYKDVLRGQVADGTLDAADSKAQVLAAICAELRFDPNKAAEVHKEIYRTRLSSDLSEKKFLSDADKEDLKRLRILLCVPQNVVDEANMDFCGRIFRDACQIALRAKVESGMVEEKANVEKVQSQLNLSDKMAYDIFTGAAKQQLMAFVKDIRSKRNMAEFVQALKKLILYSQNVVEPLAQMIRGDTSEEDEKAAEAEAEKAAEAAAAQLKIQTGAEAKEGEEKKEGEEGEEKEEDDDEAKKKEEQANELKEVLAEAMKADAKEAALAEKKKQPLVNVSDQLDFQEKVQLFSTYMQYCTEGEQMDLAFGTKIRLASDPAEFERLEKLGYLLGIGKNEQSMLGGAMSTERFKSAIKKEMGISGRLPDEKKSTLYEYAEQWSISKEDADKMIEEALSAKVADELKTQMSSGDLTLDQVRAMKKEKDMDINTVLDIGTRDRMFLKHVETSFTEAPANFDADDLLKTIPEELGLDVSKASKLVKKLADDRKRPTLIQAVSMLRQNKKAETMQAAYNLVACHLSEAGDAVAWPNTSEIEDLYVGFAKEATPAATEAMASVLGIEGSRRAELDGLVSSGGGYAFEEDLAGAGSGGEGPKKALF